MNLNDTDKNRIIELIKAGEKLPKEFIYKLFADEEDVFLFWNGRKEDKKEGDMFEMFDTRGRQLKGWTNKLIWGDKNSFFHLWQMAQ